MHENLEDLDMLAFQYIAGELSAAEAESFEQRLADDLAACEAVARAVELAQAVVTVPADIIPLPTTHHSLPARRDSEALTTHSSPRRWLRTARWFAAAAAVALGVFGFQYFKGASEQSKLAKVWANLWIGPDAVVVPEHDLVADSKEPVDDGDDELTVPGWMIEAVGGLDSDEWEDS